MQLQTKMANPYAQREKIKQKTSKLQTKLDVGKPSSSLPHQKPFLYQKFGLESNYTNYKEIDLGWGEGLFGGKANLRFYFWGFARVIVVFKYLWLFYYVE